MKRSNISNICVKILVFLIQKIWQGKIGREYKKRKHIVCRFYPTCSEYTIQALDKYGFKKGIALSYDRIKRCNQHNTESCIDFP